MRVATPKRRLSYAFERNLITKHREQSRFRSKKSHEKIMLKIRILIFASFEDGHA